MPGSGAFMPTNPVLPSADLRLVTGLPQIEPIALVPCAEPFEDPEWVFEPKYDGFRGVVYASRLGCEIRSRRDFRLKRFADLWDRVAGVLGAREVILDGEIVSLNRQGKPVFHDLIRGQGFLAFAAFDLLWLDGVDLRPRPLAERKELLAALLPEDTGPLYKILTIEEHGRALFGAIRKMDLEGIVAKRTGDPYMGATIWYMIKNLGYSQGEGRADLLPLRERTRRVGQEG
jgi:bifunctional non-homologous end joining protein LigD